MYGSKGAGVVIGAGGMAATGVPILMTIALAAILVVAGLLLLRWGQVRRPRTRP